MLRCAAVEVHIKGCWHVTDSVFLLICIDFPDQKCQSPSVIQGCSPSVNRTAETEKQWIWQDQPSPPAITPGGQGYTVNITAPVEMFNVDTNLNYSQFNIGNQTPNYLKASAHASNSYTHSVKAELTSVIVYIFFKWGKDPQTLR